MEVLYDEEVLLENETIIAIGSFDGIHLGHQRLIHTVVNESVKRNRLSLIFTFSNHPSDVLQNKTSVQKLITNEQKCKLIEHFNVDYIYLRPFTKKFLMLTPKEFIEKVLVKQIRAKLIIVGFNFRFGYRGEGTVQTLRDYSMEFGYDVIEIPPIIYDDILVSSTEIRKLISNGNVDKAKKLLGRPYSVHGTIVKGKQIGRTIGFPTINLSLTADYVVPKRGVYITETDLGGKKYQSVTSVGYNPTFNGQNITIETFIFDFNKNVYGEEAEVFFLQKIRDEIKFSGIDELIKRIKTDVEIAREFFQKQS